MTWSSHLTSAFQLDFIISTWRVLSILTYKSTDLRIDAQPRLYDQTLSFNLFCISWDGPEFRLSLEMLLLILYRQNDQLKLWSWGLGTRKIVSLHFEYTDQLKLNDLWWKKRGSRRHSQLDIANKFDLFSLFQSHFLSKKSGVRGIT